MSIPISGRTGVLAFLGSPSEHTTSPALHNEAFSVLGLDYVYVAFDIGLDRIEGAVQAIRTLRLKGANVSMPCKTAVIPYLDDIDSAAQLCGAVNTIVNEDGYLKGYSTDGVGYMTALRDRGVSIEGKKITMVGCGGAGKAIAVQAAMDGVREISIFNVRDSFWSRCVQTVTDIESHTNCHVRLFELDTSSPASMANLKDEIADSALFANATNIGMGKWEGQTYIPDSSYFRPGLTVTDVIYSPKETALLSLARSAGCNTINGQGMLFYQGAAAFRLWTGRDMPIEHMKKFVGLA